MKKMLVAALATVLILAWATASLAQLPTEGFCWYDFGATAGGDSKSTNPFDAFLIGDWSNTADGSASNGGYATPADGNSQIAFNWEGKYQVRTLVLQVYDGPGTEAFEVQVLNPHPQQVGRWDTVYSYAGDANDGWHTHYIYKLTNGAGKGQNTAVTLKVVGSVAVDWVTVYETRQQPSP